MTMMTSDHNLGKKYLKHVEVRAHRHSSPTDQMMWELGKYWDIPAKFLGLSDYDS